MNEEQTTIKCKILLDIIKEKVELLDQLYNLTLNQNTVLQSDLSHKSIFEELAKEKETRIHRINELDNFFANIYNEIKDFLSKETSSLKDTIRLLQQEIKKVSELMIQIQLYEEKNRQILQGGFTNTKRSLNSISKGKAQAAQSYKQYGSFTKKNN